VIAKTGILGGSFDPPHVGHTAMARCALETLGLDRVLLMPAPRPPHKEAGELSEWEHRLAMSQLAASGLDGVEVSLHELGISGDSFTADSLRRYREAHDEDIYFILGADSLRDLPGWREPEAILALATLVVFPRVGIEARLDVGGDASIIVFEAPVVDVSSSEIRSMRRAGQSIQSLVPESVLAYILEHSLYMR
jgi:nicotinate-nucleotide adenylyltransferase